MLECSCMKDKIFRGLMKTYTVANRIFKTWETRKKEYD